MNTWALDLVQLLSTGTTRKQLAWAWPTVHGSAVILIGWLLVLLVIVALTVIVIVPVIVDLIVVIVVAVVVLFFFFALKGQLNSYCTNFFGAVLRQACATKVTKACLISPLDAFPVQLILSHTCHILHIFEFGNSFYLRLWVPNLADQPIFFSSAGWSAAQWGIEVKQATPSWSWKLKTTMCRMCILPGHIKAVRECRGWMLSHRKPRVCPQSFFGKGSKKMCFQKPE